MAGQFPRIVHPIHKYIVNPLVMRGAGLPSNEVAILHHIGRRSGRTYLTPIIPTRVDGGFVIPLVYGETTDWCRNILSAGNGLLELNGETIKLDSPKVLSPSEVQELVPQEFAHRFHFFHHYLFVRRSTASPSAA